MHCPLHINVLQCSTVHNPQVFVICRFLMSRACLASIPMICRASRAASSSEVLYLNFTLSSVSYPQSASRSICLVLSLPSPVLFLLHTNCFILVFIIIPARKSKFCNKDHCIFDSEQIKMQLYLFAHLLYCLLSDDPIPSYYQVMEAPEWNRWSSLRTAVQLDSGAVVCKESSTCKQKWIILVLD